MRTTLKGYDEKEIINLMTTPLGAGAFKRHPTKSYLTTISPAYMRERLTKVFGLFGLGWGLDWNPANTVASEFKTSSGKPRFGFAITQAAFWYKMVDNGEELIVSFPVTGYSDNDNIGDAMAGARTSCLSAGSKELLFQLHIYKNVNPPKKGADWSKVDERVNPDEVQMTGRDEHATHIQPPPPMPTTPRPADSVIVALQMRADKNAEPASEKQLKYMRASLSKLVGSDADKAKVILLDVFGIKSSKDATSGMASAIIDWAGATRDNEYTVSPTSAEEAMAITNKDKPLFNE